MDLHCTVVFSLPEDGGGLFAGGKGTELVGTTFSGAAVVDGISGKGTELVGTTFSGAAVVDGISGKGTELVGTILSGAAVVDGFDGVEEKRIAAPVVAGPAVTGRTVEEATAEVPEPSALSSPCQVRKGPDSAASEDRNAC